MGTLSDAERDKFLSERRYGILSTLRADGSPIAVPVWFDWDGTTVSMFTYMISPKLKRLQRDPRASLLVTNHPDELERWAAFDGVVTVHKEGGLELAERLAPKYWFDDDPRGAALDSWRQMRDGWRLLELKPNAVRTYKD
jgi:PPOX class probable F420-dependent enzyme